MNVRDIHENDISSCAEIFSRVFSHTHWNENWNTQSAYERLNHFYQSKGFCGVLAENNHVIPGFVLGNIEPYYSGSIFYLREMCTDVTYQSSGIGTQLLKYLEERLLLLNTHSIYLLTEHNVPAASFYQNRGFKLENNTGSFIKTII